MRQPNWYDAGIWLMFTVLGFLVPVFVGMIVAGASGIVISLELIAGGGQFAVSGAALLMTTSYFVARPGSLSRLPLTEWFLLLAIAGLVAGATLFALATLASTGNHVINPSYYQIPSIVLFGVALVTAFVAVGLDRNRQIEEPRFLPRGLEEEKASLEEGFDSTFQ